jgi:predicted transposase YdaD
MAVSKPKKPTPQSSQYDKILKENLEQAIPSLLRDVLQIDVVVSEELPDDVQHTKERKPDALKRITDAQGQTFVLHLEFQVKDDPQMVFRMADYYLMLLRKYGIPVRQYVFYVGGRSTKMIDRMKTDVLDFRYNLLTFSVIKHELFLKANNPEAILLSILANFGSQPPDRILAEMVSRIEETASSPLAVERYISQLRVLVQLRRLQPLFNTVMDSLAGLVTEQGDPFYMRGRRIGREEGLEEGLQKGLQKGLQEGLQKGSKAHKAQVKAMKEGFVRNLLTQPNITQEQIARIAEVSSAFVRRVKKDQQTLKP